MELINIINILKDRGIEPGFRLYTIPFGDVTFDGISEFDTIMFHFILPTGDVVHDSTDMFGRLVSTGECILFPSKKSRNWYYV